MPPESLVNILAFFFMAQKGIGRSYQSWFHYFSVGLGCEAASF